MKKEMHEVFWLKKSKRNRILYRFFKYFQATNTSIQQIFHLNVGLQRTYGIFFFRTKCDGTCPYLFFFYVFLCEQNNGLNRKCCIKCMQNRQREWEIYFQLFYSSRSERGVRSMLGNLAYNVWILLLPQYLLR